MKVWFLLFTLFLLGCAPGRENQSYYPKPPTTPKNPETNPISPAVYKYYDIFFVGKENQRSTGFRVSGTQEISLPESFSTSHSSAPVLYLYSTNFMCEYNLVNHTYFKNSSCVGNYVVSNQTIYLSNLGINEEAHVSVGVYVDE